jgi:Arm DNA-binding domain
LSRATPKKCKLTPLAVAKLQAQTRPYLVWDNLQRGLVLQVQPTGYRSFKVIYRFRNRPRWYHIGAADAVSLADARRLAAEVMLEVIRGKDPAAEKRTARGKTFGELATRYVEEHAKKRNKSWQQAAKLVRRHLLPPWGGLNANAITRSDVRAVIGKVNAPVLANQVLAAASAILRGLQNKSY